MIRLHTWVTHREKGRDLTQSYDKSPYTHRKIQKATWKHKNDWVIWVMNTQRGEYAFVAMREGA